MRVSGSGARPAADEVLARSQASVVEVAGCSMEPSLPRGWLVRVGPAAGPLRPGDIVLIQTSGEPVIHRAAHVFTHRGAEWVLHVGDRGGLPGLVCARGILGRAEAIVQPMGAELPTLERIGGETRARFERVARRCRWYALCWRTGKDLGMAGGPVSRAIGAVLWRLLFR